MKKILPIALVLIVAVAVIVYLNISNITKSLIEEHASKALGVNVTISKLDINLIDKSAKVEGIKIANPKGYSGKTALELKNIEVSLGKISSELIEIKTINITGTKIFLEVTKNGTNLKDIAGNAKSGKKSSKTKEADKTAEENNPAPKIIINTLNITESKLEPKITLLKNIGNIGEISFPDIKLQGIGKKENGILIQDAISQVAEKLMKTAEQSSYNAGMLEGVAKNALEGLNVSNATMQEAKESFKQGTEDVKKLGQDLKNLFGK